MALVLLCLGSTLLYVGGMFLNDVCDSKFDAEFRRERPIVTGTISRQDFGVSWNKSLDKGGVVVGDAVALDIKLELNK